METFNTEPSAEIDTTVSPVSLPSRQLSLDFIRGIAIFGILIMNIQIFGNVFASYGNPLVNSDFTGLNVGSWFITHIFFEQKFYTIFSMLFGAGIVLMAEEASAKGLSVAKYHYRRSILLIIFGLIHGFYIWYGDILTTYGTFALFVYFGWKSRPRNLIITGIILTLLVNLLMLSLTGDSIPPEQIEEMQKEFFPNPEIIQAQINAYLGGWEQVHAERSNTMSIMLSVIIIIGIRISGCMLIGMALFKLGIITGKRTTRFYQRLAFFCLVPGLLAISYGALLIYQSGFKDAIQVQLVYGQINFLGSLLVAVGYIALFHLMYRASGFENLKRKLEAVGQMAFTNYISQSIICTLIFYGYGLGLFSALSRFEMLLVAIAVFALQLVWSQWWLGKFRFGPLEWLWRSMTYLKIQPFRKG